VVAPARWRETVAWSLVAYRLSQRRACRALEVARSSVRYIGRRPPQTALRRRLREIAEVRLHYWYRRMHVLLRREGMDSESPAGVSALPGRGVGAAAEAPEAPPGRDGTDAPASGEPAQ
jgi:putative transposase